MDLWITKKPEASATHAKVFLFKGSSWNLVGADRIPAGVQIEIRKDLWLPLGEIPLENGTTNFCMGVCSHRALAGTRRAPPSSDPSQTEQA